MLQNGTERLLEEGGILEASGVARRVDEVAAADVQALAASLAHPLLGPTLSLQGWETSPTVPMLPP